MTRSIPLLVATAALLLTGCGEEPPRGPIVGGHCDFQPVPGLARVTGVDPQASGRVTVRYRFEPTAPIRPGAWGDPGTRELVFDAPCTECVTSLGIAVDATVPITPRINMTGGGCAPWMGLDPWDEARCTCPAAAP